MDKLEKALEKAREQRRIQLENEEAERRNAPPRDNTTNPRESAFIGSNMVPIEEEIIERQHIIAHHTRSAEADIFRILRTKILQAMNQSGMKTLGITSPNYGDGKTTIALNLAVSIALDLKQTVLLVDLDLRKPNVTDYLGIHAEYGISDYFLHNVPISKCLLRPSFDRMTILPAGSVMDNSSEVLGSPKIAALANELRARYPDRLIIYDMPPTLVQDDPLAFLPNIDAVLLVVNEGATKVSDLKQSLNILSGANVIGTVLNASAARNQSKRVARVLEYMNRYFQKFNEARA